MTSATSHPENVQKPLGINKFVEFDVINNWCGMSFGGNVREAFRPVFAATVKDYMVRLGLPTTDYDLWLYSVSSDMMISIAETDQLRNRDVVVPTHKGLAMTEEKSLKAFKALSPILPSKIFNSFVPSASST